MHGFESHGTHTATCASNLRRALQVSHTDFSVGFGESQRGLDRHAETRVTSGELVLGTNCFGRVQNQPSSVSKDGSKEPKEGSVKILRGLRAQRDACVSTRRRGADEEWIGGKGTKVVGRFRVRERTSSDISRTERETARRHEKTSRFNGVRESGCPLPSREGRGSGSPGCTRRSASGLLVGRPRRSGNRCPRQEVCSSVRRARTDGRPNATRRLFGTSGQRRERASSRSVSRPATVLRDGAE